MSVLDILAVANNVEGSFVKVGFGKGKFSQTIFDEMNNGTLTKRHSYIIDSFSGPKLPTAVDLEYNPKLEQGFKPGRFQIAMDMRFELENPPKKVEILKGHVEDILPNSYDGGPIACLHIDLPSFSTTKAALETLHTLLNLNAIVYISGYKADLGITRAVERYVDEQSIKYQFEKLGNNHYLRNKIAPVFYKGTSTKKDSKEVLDVKTPVREKPILQKFADRYIKKVVPKFVAKKEIRTGLNVIGKKVTK